MTKTREERIAEWLGLYLSGCWFRTKDAILCQNYRLKEYLACPEGEVAMMDRLESMPGVEINNSPYIPAIIPSTLPKERVISISVDSNDNWETVKTKYEGKGKTRNAALQAAILQMLGKDE